MKLNFIPVGVCRGEAYWQDSLNFFIEGENVELYARALLPACGKGKCGVGDTRLF